MATVADAISQSAGLEATFQRMEEGIGSCFTNCPARTEGMQKQVLAAELNVSIAERDLEIYEKNVEHLKELDDFYKSKFTNWHCTIYGNYAYTTVQGSLQYQLRYHLDDPAHSSARHR